MQQGLFGQGLTWGVRVFGIATLTVLNTTAISHQPSYANSNKFFCTQSNGVPVTMVSTSRGNEPFIRWVVKDFSPSGFTPQRRCEVVSGRLQRYYDNGTLFITSRNNFKGYPVLCIADRQGGSCPDENLLGKSRRFIQLESRK